VNRAALVVVNYGAAAHGLHHPVEIETGGLLARREFAEALQPLPDVEPPARERVMMPLVPVLLETVQLKLLYPTHFISVSLFPSSPITK
jgi:hypothetical protein